LRSAHPWLQCPYFCSYCGATRYGHPDHIAISAATTAACARSGDTQAPERHGASLAPHQPGQLLYSSFPPKRQLLLEHIAQWLVRASEPFQGSAEFAYAMLLLCEEASLLRYSSDHVDIAWYPAGFSIVEQGERAESLYLLLSGTAEVVQEGDDGTQQVLTRLQPGAFFGDEGVAYRQARNAHVIAEQNVTCLVLSPEAPTAYLRRGDDARRSNNVQGADEERISAMEDATCISVAPYLHQKIAAIAAHRSQFPIQPDLLPLSILQALMGQEYFTSVPFAAAPLSSHMPYDLLSAR
jgi:LmbE family N-acetylglucosaminyl deacetylase